MVRRVINREKQFCAIYMKGNQATAKKEIDILSLDVLKRVIDGCCQILKADTIKFCNGISQSFFAYFKIIDKNPFNIFILFLCLRKSILQLWLINDVVLDKDAVRSWNFARGRQFFKIVGLPLLAFGKIFQDKAPQSFCYCLEVLAVLGSKLLSIFFINKLNDTE